MKSTPPDGWKIEPARRGFRFVYPDGVPSGIIIPSRADALKAAWTRHEILEHAKTKQEIDNEMAADDERRQAERDAQ